MRWRTRTEEPDWYDEDDDEEYEAEPYVIIERQDSAIGPLLPRRFAKVLERLRGIHLKLGRLGHAGFAYQRFCEPLFMTYIVEAITSLDAQSPVI